MWKDVQAAYHHCFAQETGYLPAHMAELGLSPKDLHQALAKAGFALDKAEEFYGSATKKAVMRFQKAKGLEVDGVAGPDTWAKLR